MSQSFTLQHAASINEFPILAVILHHIRTSQQSKAETRKSIQYNENNN